MARADVLVVSLATTGGWRTMAAELAGSLRRAGARVEVVEPAPPPHVRTFALTDLTQAWLTRQACLRGIAAHDPRAIVYCSSTAALLWPRPGAISLDSIAAENRPGRDGFWQRPVERRRLRQSTLLLPWSERALDPVARDHADAVVVPPPVDGEAASGRRDVAAVMYAGAPVKRRLDAVLEAWQRARREDETLVVAGVDRDRVSEIPGIAGPGVEVVGILPGDAFRALLARARVFVNAPRREDFGIAALEALAHGCRLVTNAAPGPYPALALARELDPRLVGEDLASSMRVALDAPRPGYAERAAALLAPFRRPAIDDEVARSVLPRLLRA